jgi:hypothetical protein
MKKIALAAVALVAVGALSSCSAISNIMDGDDAKRDGDGQVTTESDSNAFKIKIGDCVKDMSGETIDDVVLVPCADEHLYEAYAATNLPDGSYPSSTDLQNKADTFCADEFATFVGVGHDESKFTFTYLYPTSQSWSQGDREVMCFITTLDESPKKGSAKNAKA